eukprot:Sspe_Gene.90821::Locus_62305_Transcript_1_1_Confidence_1.000_Length_391::g.90821::m.90821
MFFFSSLVKGKEGVGGCRVLLKLLEGEGGCDPPPLPLTKAVRVRAAGVAEAGLARPIGWSPSPASTCALSRLQRSESLEMQSGWEGTEQWCIWEVKIAE